MFNLAMSVLISPNEQSRCTNSPTRNDLLWPSVICESFRRAPMSCGIKPAPGTSCDLTVNAPAPSAGRLPYVEVIVLAAGAGETVVIFAPATPAYVHNAPHWYSYGGFVVDCATILASGKSGHMNA